AMPQLLIIGSRGWANEAVFARLDSVTPGGPVRELPGLSDGAVAALLDGAQALLFPSLAEGFGLPAVEAAALGVPVIASNLPVFRDILDDYPVYLDSGDSYSWMETITEKLQAAGDANLQRKKRAALGWVAHFNAVLNLV
ncbi:MAG: glycosyltransferase, partial [Paracoccaceae bacterium]